MFISVLIPVLFSIAQVFNSIYRASFFATAAIIAQIGVDSIYIIAPAYRLGWTFINTAPAANTVVSNYMRHFQSLLFTSIADSP